MKVSRETSRGWLKPDSRYPAIALILAVSLLSASCGGNFASQLRAVLSASGPLIDSLVASGIIKPEQRQTYIQDFQDLADGAANLGDDIDKCAKTDKVCKLDAANRFAVRFFDIERRGHFKVSPKLQNVEAILQAIISAAKAYYGPTVTRAPKATEEDLKAKIAELKAAMQG